MENLPLLVLWKIQTMLEDNIDRVSLVLTCKYWFHCRSYILRFKEYNSDDESLIFNGSRVFQLVNKCYDDDITFGLDFDMLVDSSPSANSHLCYVESIDELKECPKNITVVNFGKNFNGVFAKGDIPDFITEIRFGNNYKREIGPDILPKSLKKLVFGKSFDTSIKPNVLPAGLETLSFGDNYSQPILPNSLPKTLTTLDFGDMFNHKLGQDILPPTLTRLSIGCCYIHPLTKDSLPPTLKHLSINHRYAAHQGYGEIPDSVEYLVAKITHVYSKPYSSFYQPLRNQISKNTVCNMTLDINSACKVQIREFGNGYSYILLNHTLGAFIRTELINDELFTKKAVLDRVNRKTERNNIPTYLM
ncbi:hypothetical protein SAMD00019534_001380 [Acytostelium subglobosum LB1]|uniref:hypothetical protein n=1 Tax=Acytostelium subglobosum LB1 TaxID=1410327 RepID=UPI000644A27B|nr:hypothetical protein SAMD00019534_001380 [Acytostelium subglobosum LB1]GAM16963.1 hypothetical protein SAMD00019534_001380 [Acytostelium subglobosum LB1]|eukprot:XP_012759025.1 hypothetical protein SAMD00019534_001380 [Acytostelium subglobosum LB1]